MKTVVRLRWLFLGVLFSALLLSGSAYIALNLPIWQVRLFSEPSYLSLFARSMAEKINEEMPQPVGVYKDQHLAGCNPQRMQFNYAAPLGLEPGDYQLKVDHALASEVRYSSTLQTMCTFNGRDVIPKSVTTRSVPVPGKLPLVSQSVVMPNTLEYSVGNFNPILVRQ